METRISKHELAISYAPNLTAQAALNRLSLWIKTCKPLYRALKRSGYCDKKRFFTGNQIKMIYKHLGRPPTGSFQP